MVEPHLTSIILCTHDRSTLAQAAVRDVLRLEPRPGWDFELIVVANACSDDTVDALQSIRGSEEGGGRLRVEVEPRAGLAHARNRGIEIARGEAVLFIDDDVRVRDPWLALYQEALENDPEAIAFAGPVHPDFETTRPSWLTNELLGVLAVIDHGRSQRVLDGQHFPMGANMGMRASCFERHGLFRTDLGRVRDQLFSNEDDEFFSRLFGAADRVLYVPDATVLHLIPAARLTKRYFRRWKFASGRSTARAGRDEGVRILGVPRYAFRDLAQSVGCMLLSLLFLEFDNAFRHELRARYQLGFVYERLRSKRRARNSRTSGEKQIPA